MNGRDSKSTPAPSSLGSELLARRLRELAGEERDVQVDFLLHLDEFDRRRAFLEAGHDSLWSYCLRVLHLREGAAGRRIGAMRALRRFKALEAPLRDGRLCLSTVTLLAPLLIEENLDDLVSRAAYRTKADVEHLVATIQPRVAPKEGIRRIAQRRSPQSSATSVVSPPATSSALGDASPSGVERSRANDDAAPGARAEGTGLLSLLRNEPSDAMTRVATTKAPSAEAPLASPGTSLVLQRDDGRGEGAFALSIPCDVRLAEARRQEMRPISADEWSLRVTIDGQMKAELETLKSLLSHTAGGDLAAVLREAIRCGIEKHGKRRGAEKPSHERAARSVANRDGKPGAAVNPVGISGEPAAQPVQPAGQPMQPAGQPMRGCDDVAAAKPIRAREAAAPGQKPELPRTNRRTDPRAIPIAVRREVWLRDEGCCSWVGEDGQRCRSRWKLEFDHIRPVAHGGKSTPDNLRLACRAHNVLHAEQVFGREHMARFSGRELFLEIAQPCM
ncbi:MAG TPA: HNH endonuclease signature motif containing protein [Anaeromyxobacteraceae bacterium]|nr:HNH endonuclease signature motif containing protein [Anaeromyxobacteraceae bacterium]